VETGPVNRCGPQHHTISCFCRANKSSEGVTYFVRERIASELSCVRNFESATRYGLLKFSSPFYPRLLDVLNAPTSLKQLAENRRWQRDLGKCAKDGRQDSEPAHDHQCGDVESKAVQCTASGGRTSSAEQRNSDPFARVSQCAVPDQVAQKNIKDRRSQPSSGNDERDFTAHN